MLDLSKLIITPEMLSLIGEIDEFKITWKLLGKLEPERLISLKKIATIESIGSSTRIEGAKLSDLEIEKLLSNAQRYSFVSRDEQEVAGYARVCEEIFASTDSIVFCENVIKQLHDWLLKFSHKDERHPGEYKKLSNNVEAFDETGKSVGVIFQTASPFETPMKMQELVLWTKESLENKSLHPLLVIGVFVVVFLAIHPFQDGNGRLSRILTTLLLLKSGYTYVQYTSLESIIEHNKENYYLALRTTQGSLITSTPDLYSWLIFFLRSMQKQKIHLEKKAKLSKNTHLHISAISSQISTLLIEHGRLSIGQIESITQINKNTLKKQLIKLVDSGTILRLGKGRATWYALP